MLSVSPASRLRPGQGRLERIGSAHGLQQGFLAGLAPLRPQGLFAAIAPELRQLLADAKNDIDRRLPLFTLVKIPRRSKIHRSKIPRMVIFPSTIFDTVTSFRC